MFIRQDRLDQPRDQGGAIFDRRFAKAACRPNLSAMMFDSAPTPVILQILFSRFAYLALG
jgi:hypothetical protein